MESKKNPKLELTQYSTLFFSIGLVIAIGFAIVVFEWKTLQITSEVNLQSDLDLSEELLDIPLSYQPSPSRPKISQPKIIEIPDEEEIVSNIAIDLDIDVADEIAVDELVNDQIPEEEIADEVFSIVEVMPTFPGGTAEFYNYIAQNLKYPRRALKANVEGKVILSFIVAENGGVSEVKVLKGIGFDCDEEAVRVLQSSPNWIPGQQRGRNVKVSIMVPLTFDI